MKIRHQKSRDILMAGKNLYGIETSKFAAFETASKKSVDANKNVNAEVQLTFVQKQEIESIISSISSYSNFSDFRKYLDTKFDIYAASELSVEDKSFLLTYIVVCRESLDFVANNQDLFIDTSSNDKITGWWSD